MESEEKNIAEERRKQARENSRVSEIVNSSVQPEATADNQDDNELFVAQEPAPKRARRVPCLTLTNKEIRKSINVGLHETGSSTAAPKSNSLSGFMTPKESSSRPKGKPKSKANEVDLDTLFNSDIIRDGQANAQSAPVPTFTQGNKNKALSELIASVPVASQDEAKPDKQAVLDATKKFRPLIRSDKKGGWKHRDLKTSLYHHQMLGAAFMRERESSTGRPHGGMLCDVMGLGKTIQTLANIVHGESVDLDDGAKTTLIVVPRSVLDHWKGQIIKHVEPDVLNVLYYYPGHRPDCSDIISTILSHNVVITTYEEIRRSYPKSPTSAEGNETQPLTEQEYKDSAGPLHQIRFRRIIIDEGHLIRNPESQSSVSVRALHAHFKWVLTGTPLLNHPGEFWAYFNFLDIPYIGRYANFISNYCNGEEVSTKRLVNVLRAVIFRRTHASRLFSFPIIVLPELGDRTVSIKALEVEKMIYEMIQEMYINNINSMAPNGNQQQQFRCFLVMLLKLRMCNSHPLIVQDILKVLLDDDENVMKLISIVPENADPTDPDRIIVGLLRGLLDTGESPNSGQRSPIGTLNTEFREFLQRLQNTDNEEEFHARMKCVSCHDDLTHPEITPCMHLICNECLVTYREEIQAEGGSSVMCPGTCNVEICNEEPLRLNHRMLTYMYGFTTRSGAKKKKASKRGGRGGLSLLNPGSSMDEINPKDIDWVKVAGMEMPSSKVKVTRETIRKWLGEADPGSKIVIFTQFCDMVFIFWEMCKQENWGCVKLTGDMSFPSRQGSISDFGNNAETKVMIASLKAGGIGIDLTMANKCILVEPWWNDAVQQQAFCRLFRIGQERNVEIVKIVIEDTIDVYMMQLQEKKNKNIEEAIGDQALTGRNTALELMEMFGEVEEHEGGGIVIHRRKWVPVANQQRQSSATARVDLIVASPPLFFCPRRPQSSQAAHHQQARSVPPPLSTFSAVDRRREMDDIDSLGGLRGLYQDLSAIPDSPMVNVERLCLELETHIEDFRKLLTKASKNDTSRKSVLSGKLTIGDVEYAINSDFQQGALQLADALNIDELEAASLFMAAQEAAQQLDRTPLIAAIMQFHEHRHFLLECLRLIFQESFNVEREDLQGTMQTTIGLILQTSKGLNHAFDFTKKCLSAMEEIERWLSLIGDQVQKVSVVGQADDADIMEAIEYQRSSLSQQHESLGVIVCYLFKGTYPSSEDFRQLLNRVRKLERFDMLLVHYVPSLIAAIVQYGSPSGIGTQREARSLHTTITSSQNNNVWNIAPFHAAVTAWWLSVYSGWYYDSGPASPLQGVDLEKEAEERTKLFKISLDDGALEFMLAICASVNKDEWSHPARNELVNLLLKESPASVLEPDSVASFLKTLIMDHFDTFTESCIANMPNAVRMLKSDEDTQRLNQITALRDGLNSSLHRGLLEARTYLESFLVLMAFAFEGRHEHAQEFWADTDGNLYGFLQWASKRQTVPRVSAFCEMLCSISEGEDNATAAHRFLLEEDKQLSVKFRRSPSMNWNQMFAELQLYATKVTEKPSTSRTVLHTRKSEPVDMNEPESPVMLTCYLRLMGHLSKQSNVIRNWMLQHTTFNVVNTLLTLCSGSIPTHLRASAFSTLKCLMTDRTSNHGNEMWLAIDQWISGASVNATGLAKAPVLSNQPAWHERHAFQKIGESFDQTNSFIELVHRLATPTSDLPDKQLVLPFPEALGASYRMPGIEPYIDFILGHAFSRKVPDVTEAQGRLLTLNCLDFVATCLATFNENLVVLAHQPTSNSDASINASDLNTYIRLHPFARVFEWLFNEDALKTLFVAAKQDISEVARASSESVLLQSLLRSVEVMNLILDLQSTYLNIVRPSLRNSPAITKTNVANSALASFEDSILNNLNLVLDLCLYCGTGHQQLTVVSLALLEKLSSSRKLNKSTATTLLTWQSPNRIVEVLSAEFDTDSISRPLVNQTQFDPRELEYGASSSGYLIREGLLGLLNSCLETITDRPNIAHLLLGFSCVGNSLDVQADGLLANGMSLLHGIINFTQTYPTEIDESIMSWTVHSKRVAFEVLRHLWSSKLSSAFVLSELRMSRFLMTSFISQPIVNGNTLWSNFPPAAPEFWLTDSATALSEFLAYRSHLYDYAVTEIRAASKLGSQTLQLDILSTLLGMSLVEDGETIPHATVFDLFDFADLEITHGVAPPALHYLQGVDFELCAKPQADASVVLYDLDATQELIQTRRKDFVGNNQVRPQEEEQFQLEADLVIGFLRMTNMERQIRFNRYLAVRSWAELVTTIIVSCEMEAGRRTTFILQAINLILPKLEMTVTDNASESIELARLAEALVSKLDASSSASRPSRGGDVIDEKLYQLFQVSLRGISLAVGNVSLRESFYNICAHYLARITLSQSTHHNLRHQTQQAVRTSGVSLVEAICDDGYAGQESCRVSALLLLNLLAELDAQEKSFLLADAISQSNYLNMFLDSIKTLPSEFRETQAQDVPLLLSYYRALLSLLQKLCQTKPGATQVLNAGLFSAIRESRLFAADPDIGIDMDNPNALRNYYELLVGLLRVIVLAVFSRGLHNEQMMDQTRAFLAENRPSMVGVFKRYAKIGGESASNHREAVHDLVKAYVALVSATGFVEFEDDEFRRSTGPKVFS